MTIYQALILGLVQGLTEFIPVSSTAHLILVEWLLGWSFEGEIALAFNVIVQLGTAAAVLIYFWRDLWSMARALLTGFVRRAPFRTAEGRLAGLLLLATVPAGVLGLALRRVVAELHQNAGVVAALLIAAAALLFLGERVGSRSRALASATALDALLIGSAQALALIPGVSRSAATMAAGLALNLDRPSAARFSFLMSLPILLAAGLFEAADLALRADYGSYLPPIGAAFAAAAVAGFASIHWLLAYLSTHSFHTFAWYRIAAGTAFLGLYVLQG